MVAINPVKPAKNASPDIKPAFRWTYIILPVLFLFISLILTAFFYRLLPTEIAYRFQGDTPGKWMGRGALVLLMNLPQAVFVLLSVAVVRLVLLGTRHLPPGETPVNRLLPVMGNMVALPQAILLFVILSVFLYNSYQIKLIPVWIFAVIIMISGGVILGVFFLRTFRRFYQRQVK